MIIIKNRYRKTLYKIKNENVLSSSGKPIGKVSEDGLLNNEGEVLAKVSDTQVLSVDDGSMIAQVLGTEVRSANDELIGYVDGTPNRHFAHGAAVLVKFAFY